MSDMDSYVDLYLKKTSGVSRSDVQTAFSNIKSAIGNDWDHNSIFELDENTNLDRTQFLQIVTEATGGNSSQLADDVNILFDVLNTTSNDAKDEDEYLSYEELSKLTANTSESDSFTSYALFHNLDISEESTSSDIDLKTESDEDVDEQSSLTVAEDDSETEESDNESNESQSSDYNSMSASDIAAAVASGDVTLDELKDELNYNLYNDVENYYNDNYLGSSNNSNSTSSGSLSETELETYKSLIDDSINLNDNDSLETPENVINILNEDGVISDDEAKQLINSYEIYSDEDEKSISYFVDNFGYTREQAIEKLKEQGTISDSISDASMKPGEEKQTEIGDDNTTDPSSVSGSSEIGDDNTTDPSSVSGSSETGDDNTTDPSSVSGSSETGDDNTTDPSSVSGSSEIGDDNTTDPSSVSGSSETGDDNTTDPSSVSGSSETGDDNTTDPSSVSGSSEIGDDNTTDPSSVSGSSETGDDNTTDPAISDERDWDGDISQDSKAVDYLNQIDSIVNVSGVDLKDNRIQNLILEQLDNAFYNSDVPIEDKFKLVKYVSSLDPDLNVSLKANLYSNNYFENLFSEMSDSISNDENKYSIQDLSTLKDKYVEYADLTDSDFLNLLDDEFINSLLDVYKKANNEEKQILNDNFDTARTIQQLYKNGTETTKFEEFFDILLTDSSTNQRVENEILENYTANNPSALQVWENQYGYPGSMECMNNVMNDFRSGNISDVDSAQALVVWAFQGNIETTVNYIRSTCNKSEQEILMPMFADIFASAVKTDTE